MSTSRIVWMVGGVSAAAFACTVGLFACSSSNSGTSSDAGTHDTGVEDTGTVQDAGTGADTSSGMDSGGSGDDSGGDSGGNCENPPKTFPESTPGVYCPFSGVDGGDNVTCAAGQHCCETPASANTPSTCQPLGTPCPVTGSVDWQCEEAIDCKAADGGTTATPICCGQATGTPMPVTSCGKSWVEPSMFTGTKCAASCAAPNLVVCETNADCTSMDAGSTCTPTKASGNDFGFCTP